MRVWNKSSLELTNVRLSLTSSEFTLTIPSDIVPIRAFATEERLGRIAVSKRAKFGSHHLVLVCDFDWRSGTVFHSSRANSLSLQVVRQYENEATGLPGGSAALLYLILPIIPAFLAYDLLEGLRQGQGLKIPKFDSAYIAPAFLIAIAVEYLLVLNARRGSQFSFTEPDHLLGALAFSTAAGATIPTLRIGIHLLYVRRNSFRESDQAVAYLKKALKQHRNGKLMWVQGSGMWSNYEGLLLDQPNQGRALGARLQVSPSRDDPNVRIQLEHCIDEHGTIADADLLLRLIESGDLTLSVYAKVVKAGTRRDEIVLTHDLQNFCHGKSEDKSIVERVV